MENSFEKLIGIFSRLLNQENKKRNNKFELTK